jgi:hypothetical protein
MVLVYLGTVAYIKNQSADFDRYSRAQNSLKGKPEVKSATSESWKWKAGVIGCHFLLIGGCRETGISGKIRLYPATIFASTRFAAIGITVLI